MARQPVHLAHIPTLVERLCIHIVRREIIAPADDESGQVAVLTRHPVQRLNARHHGHVGQHGVVAMHEHLRPRTIHRHRLDSLAILGQAPVLNNAARFEMIHRLAVRQLVERHRQVELIRAHAQIRTGQRHTFTVARELELRRRWPQRAEDDIAIAQNEHAPTGHATVHTPRHLQNLVRTQVHTRQHILAAINHVGKAGVVDHHRVEPLHIERTLARSGHREQVRLLHRAVQERPNHANGFAAMIELCGDPPEPRLHTGRDLLNTGARRKEHPNPTLFLHYLREEFVVNEMLRIGAHHFNSRRFCGIKRARFHHRIGIEIPTIKFRVDGGRQPDKAAAHALTQCEAELKFRARLVDFVHHERVLAANIPVLKPAPRDPRGHNHHIPTRRFGRRFALAIDDAHAQVFGAEQFLRDWFYAERLAGAGARDDPKATARLGDGRFEVMRAEPFGEFAELDAAGFPQHRLEVEREGELDCLARGACGRDDDDTARLPRSDKGVVIGREIRVADVA